MKKLENYSRCLTWSMALLLSALATGCGGGGGGQDPILGTGAGAVFAAPANAIIPGAVCPAAGATIPAVTMSDPTSGNQFAPTSTIGVANSGKLITATFSLPMLGSTISAASFSLAPVGGALLIPASVSYNATSQVATLTTSSALSANTSYTAVIQSTVTSAAGTPMGCSYAWTFKTAAVAAAGPSPVNLGTATSFGIASAAGITNTLTAPNTRINGNAVLSPTATCSGVTVDAAGGFGLCGGKAPTINGTVFSSQYSPPAGPTPAQIKTDLRAAYDSIMKANMPNATVLGCGTIGSSGGGGALTGCAGNSTLPPGVYISSTNSSIGVTGTLTLDGQGDQNARFIFQMPSSTLTTATGAPGAPAATINLINGAKASNVFWQVGSSATIGAYSLFQGNILADSSITMETGSTSCGRLLAGAVTATGAFVFDSNVVSVPGNASGPAGCQ
ncbi:MAG: hypothetical protein JWQ21_3775 [Herminiimonas sp.]|nr:hypothetical protein [Herminiimonas sp.]